MVSSDGHQYPHWFAGGIEAGWWGGGGGNKMLHTHKYLSGAATNVTRCRVTSVNPSWDSSHCCCAGSRARKPNFKTRCDNIRHMHGFITSYCMILCANKSATVSLYSFNCWFRLYWFLTIKNGRAQNKMGYLCICNICGAGVHEHTFFRVTRKLLKPPP